MRILVLVPKLDGDLVVGEGEKFFAEPVVLLLLPLLGQEVFDGGSPGEEDASVTPYAVGGVCSGAFLGILSVPQILCLLDLGTRGLLGEWWIERHDGR